jgi:dGTPase
VFGPNHELLSVKRNVPSLLAAVGLAHDLGNPPFGHQGEVAIQQWFIESSIAEQCGVDFLEFDGNAQTFRLLTRLQVLNDQYGLNLTLGTLAALIKYPSVYGSINKGGFKKFGVFKSEAPIIKDVWANTGLSEGIRHPLAYIMEACDDIAYSIIDAEDTVKKGYASFYDLMDFLETDNPDESIKEVVHVARKKNEEFKEYPLSSRELNDISMQMFRVKAISVMVESATNVFIQKIGKMMNGTIEQGFELIKNSNCAQLCKSTKEFDLRYGFQNKEVLRLELQGNNYIKSTMTMLWKAISSEGNHKNPFERYAFGGVSENYRRVYHDSDESMYAKCQLLCDAISGMTESYLIKKHDELKSLENAPS